MSEVKSRPSVPRGRGSARGGRGSYNTRGGRANSRHTNGDLNPDFAETPSYEDEGELGQLKKLYTTKLSTMKEMFPDWTDEDLVFALQETDGNLEHTIERISEGVYPVQFFQPRATANVESSTQGISLSGVRSRKRPKIALSQRSRTHRPLWARRPIIQTDLVAEEVGRMVFAVVEAVAQNAVEELVEEAGEDRR